MTKALLAFIAIVLCAPKFNTDASAADILVRSLALRPDKFADDLGERSVSAGETAGIPKTAVTTVSANNRDARIVLPADPSVGGASLTRFLNDQNAMAVISAGFLSTSTPATPAGLLKYQGQLYNELSMSDPVLGAAVCFSGGIKSTNVQIVSREDSETIQKASDCFQAGPLLISNGLVDADLDKLDGETNKFSSGIYARSFLLVNKHGNIVLGYSPASSLLVLRSLMLLPEAAGGLEAVSAVGFTGAETAGLLVTGKEPRKFGEVTLPLPDAIAIGQISHTPAQD